MKVHGKMVKDINKKNLPDQMDMYTKVHGKMAKEMDKENILILMGMYKKVHLKMTYTSLILRRVKNKYFLPCVIFKKED